MPRIDIVEESAIEWTIRARQTASMFGLNCDDEKSAESWSFEFEYPKQWNVGLIVGPSGSGKSTVARKLFDVRNKCDWSRNKAVIDEFPTDFSVKEVCRILSSVGFSSPPAWLRPYHVLSTGEQFRVSVARLICEQKGVLCIDEFTSVVDRTVAKIGSAAIEKHVRKADKQLVAVTCHFDVEEWLRPDWVLKMPEGVFSSRRRLRPRPPISLKIRKGRSEEWELFRRSHYLSSDLSPAAKCYVGEIEERAACFTAVLHFPHPKRSGWREHRTVTLPDFHSYDWVSSCIAAVENDQKAKSLRRRRKDRKAEIRKSAEIHGIV